MPLPFDTDSAPVDLVATCWPLPPTSPGSLGGAGERLGFCMTETSPERIAVAGAANFDMDGTPVNVASSSWRSQVCPQAPPGRQVGLMMPLPFDVDSTPVELASACWPSPPSSPGSVGSCSDRFVFCVEETCPERIAAACAANLDMNMTPVNAASSSWRSQVCPKAPPRSQVALMMPLPFDVDSTPVELAATCWPSPPSSPDSSGCCGERLGFRVQETSPVSVAAAGASNFDMDVTPVNAASSSWRSQVCPRAPPGSQVGLMMMLPIDVDSTPVELAATCWPSPPSSPDSSGCGGERLGFFAEETSPERIVSAGAANFDMDGTLVNGQTTSWRSQVCPNAPTRRQVGLMMPLPFDVDSTPVELAAFCGPSLRSSPGSVESCSDRARFHMEETSPVRTAAARARTLGRDRRPAHAPSTTWSSGMRPNSPRLVQAELAAPLPSDPDRAPVGPEGAAAADFWPSPPSSPTGSACSDHLLSCHASLREITPTAVPSPPSSSTGSACDDHLLGCHTSLCESSPTTLGEQCMQAIEQALGPAASSTPIHGAPMCHGDGRELPEISTPPPRPRSAAGAPRASAAAASNAGEVAGGGGGGGGGGLETPSPLTDQPRQLLLPTRARQVMLPLSKALLQA
eukprot:CAMPEP_0203856036 /NCGR_PEP_ID=MMETSP0359-20131031/9956_1 /ASSEMBLY_ACC=CAM_ASM_000338 /TAXON_ID=268821 /ORGANISM="Scrippsiella Hangoei, Strain SHTV-5" /LENGTH=629 /DNA_ID=CAMNT_0050772615 /DNA_START=37 /DNA_END=1926 /DNA_ORIENTATION=-